MENGAAVCTAGAVIAVPSRPGAGQRVRRPSAALRRAFSAGSAHVIAGQDDLHAPMPRPAVLVNIAAAADRRTGFGFLPPGDLDELDLSVDAREIAPEFRHHLGEQLLLGCPQKP